MFVSVLVQHGCQDEYRVHIDRRCATRTCSSLQLMAKKLAGQILTTPAAESFDGNGDATSTTRYVYVIVCLPLERLPLLNSYPSSMRKSRRVETKHVAARNKTHNTVISFWPVPTEYSVMQ